MPAIKFPGYFKTRDGLVCHTVSECSRYGRGKLIGLPKYFPALGKIESPRIIDGHEYLDHLPSFHDSMERTRNFYAHYMRYVPSFGEELCIFDVKKDIVKVYDPKQTAEAILRRSIKNDTARADAKQLMLVTSRMLGIDHRAFGIEGSIMLGCTRPASDVDAVVYGEKMCVYCWAGSGPWLGMSEFICTMKPILT